MTSSAGLLYGASATSQESTCAKWRVREREGEREIERGKRKNRKVKGQVGDGIDCSRQQDTFSVQCSVFRWRYSVACRLSRHKERYKPA